MAHKRKAIRQALVTLLTNATDAEERVYPNRSRNLSVEQLPVIIVHDGNEAPVPRDISSRQYIRSWPVSIEVRVANNTRPDEALDDILEDIENAISADRTIGSTASTALYAGTDEPDFDSTGEVTIGTTRINFEIKYLA